MEMNLPMGKIQQLEKRINEQEEYLESIMGSTCNLLEQLALTQSDFEIEVNKAKKINEKKENKMVNNTQAVEIINTVISKMDSDGDGVPDINGAKTLLNRLKDLIDVNKDGKFDKKDVKEFLIDLVTIVGFAFLIMWQMYDGDLITILLSGNSGAISEFLRILCFGGIIPIIKYKYKTKLTNALGLTQDLTSENAELKQELVNQKQEILELKNKHQIDLLKKEQEIEIVKLNATTSNVALKTSILELTDNK